MEYLLNDVDVVKFIVTGYHIVEPDLPDGLNETIASSACSASANLS